MSKKISIVISVILFIILMVLIVCEKMNPEAGTALIHSIFNDRGVLNEKKALRKGRKSKALQKFSLVVLVFAVICIAIVGVATVLPEHNNSKKKVIKNRVQQSWIKIL